MRSQKTRPKNHFCSSIYNGFNQCWNVSRIVLGVSVLNQDIVARNFRKPQLDCRALPPILFPEDKYFFAPASRGLAKFFLELGKDFGSTISGSIIDYNKFRDLLLLKNFVDRFGHCPFFIENGHD